MSNMEQDRWSRVKGRLRSSVGEDVYSSWFARMDLESVQDESVHLSVPTRFLKSWIQAHYAERVLTCWQAEMPEVHRVDVTVRTAMRVAAPAKEAPAPVEPRRSEGRDGRPSSELRNTAIAPVSASHEALGGSPLDPRLTFGSFVVGRSNTLAHAAARQVAEGRRGDSVMFNPLYIHAGVGLGKTHLLQAVTWAGNSGTERKVLYLTAADRPPSDLESLDERVRSRLAGGLVVEMGSLGEELRLGILKSRVAAARAHHATFDVPAPVLDYLARTITHNGRDLEGAINRLLAHSKLNATPVTLEMAEREVRDLIRPMEPKRIKIEDIQRVVARQYNVSRSDLLSSRRTANVVRPRQVAMYLAKTLTLRSLPEIGRRFGGRDHTTVLHAVRKIEALVGKDVALQDEVESLKRQLQE
jgi:chromosomal replication initiator protein